MPVGNHVRRFGSRASTHREASAVPAFAVPLPVFSPPAFAASLAASAAEAPVSPLPEEACAAPDVRPAEDSADAELVGSGSAGVDYFPDEQVRNDCSAGPQADDSSPAG